jgi:hypothetical protein
MKILLRFPFTSTICILFAASITLIYAQLTVGGARVTPLSVVNDSVDEFHQSSNTTSAPAEITTNFLDALAMVESSGRDNVKPGDGGRALGRYQIHDIYRREANRIVGRSKYTSTDRHSPEKAEQMIATVLKYWSHYHARRGVYIGPSELCSLHRQPNGRWSPDNMLTSLERGRTTKLMKYLN